MVSLPEIAIMDLVLKYLPDVITEEDFFSLMKTGLEIQSLGDRRYLLKCGSLKKEVRVLSSTEAGRLLEALECESKAEAALIGRSPELLSQNNNLIKVLEEIFYND